MKNYWEEIRTKERNGSARFLKTLYNEIECSKYKYSKL